MHISLDSALGRQRRLNSVGESVFQIAPDAAAGYSLRSLTGGDPAVVRVRRESDNNERDFNASGVSSGELVNWVNEQITPPLDVRELTATGRDGPIIEAAAAYSLRNLSSSYTGSVVDVRRDSDGNTESFTAAEVTDGTLTTWVGAGNDGTVSKWYDQSTTSGVPNAKHAVQTDPASQPKIVDGGSLVLRGNKPSINFFNDALESPVAVSQTTMSVFTYAQPAADGDTGAELRNRCLLASGTAFALTGPNSDNQWGFRYGGVVTFSYSSSLIRSMNLHTFLGGTTGANYFSSGSNVYTDTVVRSNSTLNGFTIGRKPHITGHNTRGYISEMIIYDSDQTDNRTALEANIGEVYGIAGIPAYEDTVNGFVETWYDQSGNGNDATQLTAIYQPTIVSAGALVQEGGNPSLEFDGPLARQLATTQGYIVELSQNSASVFVVAKATTTNNSGYILTEGDSVDPYSSSFIVNGPPATDATLWVNGDTFGTGYPLNTQALGGFIYDGITFQAYLNGSADGSGTVDLLPETSLQSYIGSSAQPSGSTVNNFSGLISEIITYKSDQSANRPAIEANINNQYDIYS